MMMAMMKILMKMMTMSLSIMTICNNDGDKDDSCVEDDDFFAVVWASSRPRRNHSRRCSRSNRTPETHTMFLICPIEIAIIEMSPKVSHKENTDMVLIASLFVYYFFLKLNTFHIHSKNEKICGFCFTVSTNLRKKCVNRDDIISRQKCVNQSNV